MKGNSSKFLALLLSASMIMSPTASVLADTQENAAQTESSAAAEAAPQSEETTETVQPETTPAENVSSESAAETPAEEPTEAPAEDQTTAGADETETPSAEEDASKDAADETAKDGEETGDTTEKEPEAAEDETGKDADAETPAEETKETEKDSEKETVKENEKEAVKEDAGKTAEQPKTEEKETVKKEASDNAAEKKEEKAEEAAKPADGEYDSDASVSGNKMFRVISSKLIVKDGTLKASVLLSGTGYDYLYLGTAAEADAADKANWIAPVGSETYTESGEEKTGYRFEIPVAELDKEIGLAVHAKKSNKWSERTITFHSTDAIPTVTPEPTETPAPSVTPGEDSSETPVSVEAPVVKENGDAFKMFLISEATMINKGDKLVLTLKTKNISFDKMYLGKNDDLAKAPVIQGMQEAGGGYSFSFEVDADKAGTTIPVVLGKTDGTWYTTKYQLSLVVPGTKTPDTTPTPEPSETPAPTETPGPTETPAPSETPAPTPEPSKVENGIYSGSAETGAAMFKVVNMELTVKDGAMKALITLSGVAYDYLYMGTPEEAAAADKSTWIAGIGTADYTTKDGQTKTGMQYEIPVAALDQPLTVASHSEKQDKWYARTITIASSSLEKTADLPADETDKVADGIYEAEAATNAAMFKVVRVKLTAKDGKMTAVITLSGSGYDYLYMGAGKDAAADSSAWIASTGKEDYTLNGETKTGMQFEIPVEALDQELAVAAHAVKSGKWFDRTITIASSSLKKTGDLPSDNVKPTLVPTKTPTVSPSETPVVKPTATPTPAPTQKPADTKPEQESKYESDLSGGTSKVNSSTTLADGVYTPDGFSFSGGSGKVTISCSKITVTNGQAYATIAFSSPYYGYVKANGNKYLANVSGGSSIFTIPVQLNQNNTIIGMTTRMSVAHEISYNIFISLAAAKNGGSASTGTGFVKADGTTSTISTDNSKLDTTAPEIMGLEYKAETKLAYAEYFKMYHYDEGITLLEIDMTKDTERDPEKQTEDDKKAEDADTTAEDTAAATDEEEAAAVSDSKKTSTEKAKDLTEKTKELYEGNVVKYLIVPKDVEIPAGLDKDMIVIQLPVEKAYVASEDALKLLDEQLDASESIKAVGMEQKDCEIENIAKAMEEKTISFDGAFDDLDYKALVKDEIDFAILPSEFLPGNAKDEEEADAADETADTKAEDQKDDKDDKTTDEKADEDKTPEELLKEENERLSDTAERLATLTIPMLVDRSADEKTDLAKAEWLKVYGVIFGCEDEANELFQQMVKAEENK